MGNKLPRFLRKTLAWLGGLLLATFLLYGLGHSLVTGPAAARKVKQTLLEAINSRLAGRVEMGELELGGLNLFSASHVVLKDLVLFDPEGARVVEVPRLELFFKLEPSQRKLLIENVVVERPRLDLRKDERGLNLSRAIAQTGTSTDSGSEEPGDYKLELAGLRLTRGLVELTVADQGLEQHFTVALDDSSGWMKLATLGSKIDCGLSLSGGLKKPSEQELVVNVKLAGAGERFDWTASLELGEAALLAGGKLDGTQKIEVELENLALPPELLRVFVPDYPLQVPLTAKGQAKLDGNELGLKLAAEAGTARLSIGGDLDLTRLRAKSVSVKADGIDLSELLAGGMKTDLSLSLAAEGGGRSLDELEGSLHLEVPTSTVEGQTLGPLRVRANGKEGALFVEEVFARLPGAQVSASGSGTAKQLEVKGKLSASSLEALSRTLFALTGAKAPKVSGHGVLALSARGPLMHPALFFSGTLPELRAGDLEVRGLKMDASLADIRRPMEAQGKLQARLVRVGERQAEDVRMAVTTAGRRLSADLSARGLADLLVHLGGTLDAGGQGARLDEVAIRYPGAEWALQEPFSLRWAETEFDLERFTLRSGRQTLSVKARTRGQTLDASLEAEHLSLGSLPKALVPPSLGLDGELAIKANATGRLAQPLASLQLTWSGGALGGVREIDATVEARYAKSRVEGSLRARSALGQLEAELSVPVSKREEKLQASVRLIDGDLAGASALMLPKGPLLRGKLRLDARVEGTLADPRINAQLETGELQLVRDGSELPLLTRGTFTVSSAEQGALAARVEGQLPEGGRAVLSLSTPLTLGALLSAKNSTLRSTPFVASAELGGIEARWLSKFGAGGEELSGRLDGRFSSEGTVEQPRGTLELTVSGASVDGLPPTDFSVSAQAGEGEVSATALASRASQRMVRLSAKLGASLASLLSKTSLASTPIELSGSAGPFPLSELGLSVGEEHRAAALSGSVQARLSGSGTLGAPKLQLFASAEQLALGKTGLGRVELDYRYADSQSVLEAKATSPGGGSLAVKAAAELNLSLDALKRGPRVSEAPFEAKLFADHFDLRFLSGIYPRVRLLEGELRADATARGTLKDVAYNGLLEWNNGRISLIGLGDYKQVHLLVKATQEKVELKEFTAHSGGGSVELAAVATKQREGYALTARGQLSRFPVVSDDQLIAIATAKMTAQGEITANRINIRELAIPEARAELPELKRKDLQDLDRPDDVVLVRNGQPLFPRKKEALPDVSRGVASVDAGATEGPMQYWITLAAPRNLWVKSADVNLELGLSEGFRIEYADHTSLFGEVHVLRGKAEMIGRKFELQKDSQLRFAGAAASPYINLVAVHQNDREGVTVFVNLTGRGKDVVLKPSSKPPMPESEIYTLLATGRRTLKRGSGSTMSGAQAASVMGGYLASQLKTALAKKLPLDVVSVQAGDEGLSGTRVEAGTYLSDQVYLGYELQLGADHQKGQNSNAGRLEYLISRFWTFEATAGDARAGGAELVWREEY